MNDNCSSPFRWNFSAFAIQQPSLYACIVASIIHLFFWIQLIFFPGIRQRSLQWVYSYLILDIILLFRFFCIYIVRTKSTDCHPPRDWYLTICYFEAFSDNYLNVLQVYILLALNICRYIQISHNRNVYNLDTKFLVAAHLVIYLFPFVFLIIQFFFGWSRWILTFYDSCDSAFTSVYVQIINILVALILPIGLNIALILASAHHVHLTARLRRTDQRNQSTAREKYNRSLVIQFLIFYIVWLVLWSPNIITNQLTIGYTQLKMSMKLLNYIEIALDPFIVSALDVRFWHVWRRIGKKILEFVLSREIHGRRVRPVPTNMNVFSVRTPQ